MSGGTAACRRSRTPAPFAAATLELGVSKSARDAEDAKHSVAPHPAARSDDARDLVGAACDAVVPGDVDGEAAAAQDRADVADVRNEEAREGSAAAAAAERA